MLLQCTAISSENGAAYHVIKTVGRGGYRQLLKVPFVLSPVMETARQREHQTVNWNFSGCIPVVDVVQVNGLVVDGRPVPLEEESIGIVAGQVGNPRSTGTSNISLNNNGFRGLSFMLPGEGFEPQLVLGVRFCKQSITVKPCSGWGCKMLEDSPRSVRTNFCSLSPLRTV